MDYDAFKQGLFNAPNLLVRRVIERRTFSWLEVPLPTHMACFIAQTIRQ
jgi:hypothetical protein